MTDSELTDTDQNMINVTTEPTPNPATKKFLPGRAVMESGTANFPSADTAAASPLAIRLFGVDGVSGVFLGADFISVAKRGAADWAAIEPLAIREIAAHFETGAPVMESRADADAGVRQERAEDAADADVIARIRELLDTRIRPSVALDGGDIVYRGFERGVVYLSLQGACLGCPSSSATLKMGVENLLKHYVPDVLRVEAVS